MRKGLTVTLMSVSILTMAAGAMAMAPVIGEIPSPIVGDAESVTPANLFVYPDAFNLANYAHDDDTASADLKWSFEIVGSSKYSINGVTSMNTGGGDDPINPGAKQINNQVLGGEENPDGNVATLTIRNVNLSPIGGPNTDPGAAGIVDSETQLVTLYASDGTTYSMKSVFFYTDNDGADRLSGGEIPVVEYTFEGGPMGWEWHLGAGVCSSSTAGGTALCIETGLTGINFGWWESPYGALPLVKNAVYRIRATVNSTQTTPYSVPFWDLNIQNFKVNPEGSNPPWNGFNLYGCSYFWLDNVGGANAAFQTPNGQDFVVWWAPAPIDTAQFNDPNTGIFAAANAADKDGVFGYRILDNDDNPGIRASEKFGSLCLTNLQVHRFDLDQMQMIQAGLYDATMSDGASGGTVYYDLYNSATAVFNAGVMTVTPTVSGRDSMLVQVQPGDFDNRWFVPSTLPDNYPVPWEAETLYQVTTDLSAPTEADATNAPGVFWVGADTPTNELINLSWFTAGAGGCATPKTGTPQTYMSFFWSRNVTLDPTPEYMAFRPRIQVGNARTLGLVFPNNDNSGAFNIHNMKVNKVTFTQ